MSNWGTEFATSPQFGGLCQLCCFVHCESGERAERFWIGLLVFTGSYDMWKGQCLEGRNGNSSVCRGGVGTAVSGGRE